MGVLGLRRETSLGVVEELFELWGSEIPVGSRTGRWQKGRADVGQLGTDPAIEQWCHYCEQVTSQTTWPQLSFGGVPHSLCSDCSHYIPIDPLRERVRAERRKRWNCSACGAEANMGIFKTCWRCHAPRFAGRAAA